MINKDELKNELTIDQVFDFVSELGGEPKWTQAGEAFVSHTICHNPSCCGSHKLFYYGNTHLFKCYTECSDAFDIYELVRKHKSINDNKIWSLPGAIRYVGSYFGFNVEDNTEEDNLKALNDWKKFKNYNKLNKEEKLPQNFSFKTIDKNILKYYPHPHIGPWEREGISYEVEMARGIAYDPVQDGIIIPHHDADNNLIGIRERTLIKEEEVYGKYRPAILGGIMYNHPLGFNLYNLNNSKDNIHSFEKAIIFEGEKSCLLYASYFGLENDISVAVCGSSLISHQVQLLKENGAKELIIAFDKQFQKSGDKEWKNWTKKLEDIHKKYGNQIQISFMFDKGELLGYKDSPIDKGKDIFLKLFKERIVL